MLLELKGIDAGYGDTVVLRDVSLGVPESKMVALLGPNGAGKSTLLRTAAGIVKPKRGSVHFAGEEVSALNVSKIAGRGLCFVPEGRAIFPSLSVRDNLLVYSARRGSSSLERALQAFPILGTRFRQIAGTLSGGEQQMLALARAYIAEPKMVLVDEASLGLAPRVVERIFEFFKDICRDGTSLLLVEQYVTRALEVADLIYILSQGQIVYQGEPGALREEDIFEHYIGTSLGQPEP